MPCLHPIKGCQDPETGKVRPVPDAPFQDDYLEVPCGQCRWCRLDRSRQWAVRIMHEATQHERNCFLTLTYDDDHLPEGRTLVLADWQNFAKKLRHKVGPFRFFHCGEYGEQNARPHYHAIIHGHDFRASAAEHSVTRHGDQLWTSQTINECWDKGFHTIGNCTFESAAYVARYIMKKVTGQLADPHYGGRKPEYTTMSRNPGLGSEWIRKFHSEVYPSDEVIMRGVPCKPPKFYDRWLEKHDSALFDQVKESRAEGATERASDNTTERLAVKEAVLNARLEQFHRKL